MPQSYNEVIRYAAMREIVQARTGTTTDMLMQNWIGGVLELAARKTGDADEPPVTSLCVHADGTIGPGYDRAPKYPLASTAADIELRAAEDRLKCYREYATDLPADGGTPTLTPEVQIKRRTKEERAWLDRLIARGVLSARDRVPFRDHLEIARLLGFDYQVHQRDIASASRVVTLTPARS